MSKLFHNPEFEYRQRMIGFMAVTGLALAAALVIAAIALSIWGLAALSA